MQPVTVATMTPNRYRRFVKPAFDRVLGAVLLVVAAPGMGAIAIAIRMTMGAPFIFKQRRVGERGQEFTVYKFRTMGPDRRRRTSPIDSERRLTHKSPTDPRLTKIGQFLRRWSLDELPQLWNVVTGTMSLVGPRPELVEIVARYEPWQHRRHEVRPGFTGLWQVTARGDTVMHEATDIDLDYVDSVSLRLDVRILIRTLPAALGRQKGF